MVHSTCVVYFISRSRIYQDCKLKDGKNNAKTQHYALPQIINFNPFPKQALVLTCLEYGTILLKKLTEKEKLLVMINFSFSYSVFY